ncbi:hypothetical protein [Rheinheimera aquimaris]|uniref:hypothetical protein n=1 Tax=Rheinheimera aquimaris TaxID=412437 RepID=UPI003A96A70F
MRSMTLYIGFTLCTFNVSSAENISDHELFCSKVTQLPCLLYIRQQLTALPPASVSWFKVKSYELDYLFDKQKFAELKQQTEQLLTLTSAPGSFSAQLYFYHAKVLYSEGDTEPARRYAGLALNQLRGAFDTFGAPLRLVELANLHYSLREYDKADAILNDAAAHFKKNKDPLFWFEWYSNKALIEHGRGQLAIAASMREQAVNAAKQMGHNGKMIIALGNLARTQQLLQQYGAAYMNYQQAMTYMLDGSDDINKAIYQLRMAEISWQSGQYQQAVNHLLALDKTKLRAPHLVVYDALTAEKALAELAASPASAKQ